MSKQACKRLRRTLGLDVNRQPLPNHSEGYPLFYIFLDGGAICAKCVNDNVDEIEEATRKENRRHPSGCGGWALAACDIHWEGEPEICDHCGGTIESAYGEVEVSNGRP